MGSSKQFMKEILIAFVSTVSEKFINSPIVYPNLNGKPYSAVQTNEAAIVYLARMFGENSLEQIFLIASDKVKNEQIETEFGKITHLEFLKRRITKEFPSLAEKFSETDYSDFEESFDGLKKNILQIAQIADAVTNFAKNFPAEKFRVHADMTGGFRHTSMLMLSIIQLLKYRGFETGEVLYSDPTKKIVYRANEIQEVSLLITGADEFVKFGSVNALREYFGENPENSLAKLLDAMDEFSDAIKICRTDAIEGELKNLGQHIKNFRENKSKDVKSELFSKIIDTVENEYGKLLSDNASRLDIIRWCMEKGFWQQAITLCTEWLPEEIVDREIFKPKSKVIEKDAEIRGKSFGRNWKQTFIISYKKTNADIDSNEVFALFLKKFREVLDQLSSGEKISSVPDEFGELKKLVKSYEKANNLFTLCKSGVMSSNELKKRFPAVYYALKGIYEDEKNNPTYKKSFREFLKKFRYENLFSRLSKINREKLPKIFRVDEQKAVEFVLKNYSELAESNQDEPSGDKGRKNYNDMLDNGVATSKLQDREKILDLLGGYYDLRQARNKINHASEHSEQKISSLKIEIENYLNELEKIPSGDAK